jgi:hypothetical protein
MRYAGIIIICTGVVFFVFVAPYKAYRNAHATTERLMQETNRLSDDIAFFKVKIMLIGKETPNYMRDHALQEFDNISYTNSCRFFEEYYAEYPFDNGQLISTTEGQAGQAIRPIYVCAMLRTNRMDKNPTNGYPQEALGQFQESLEEITNRIGLSVNDRAKDNYDNSENLRQVLECLGRITNRVPDVETDFVSRAITTVTELRKRVKAYEAETGQK